MLTFDQIKELIELVAKHRMTGMELERSGFRLQIDGYPAPEVTAPAAPHAPAAPVASAPPGPAPPVASPPPGGGGEVSAPADAAAEDPHPGAEIVTSPLVGTFYRRPKPDADPFVEVGDRVKVDQVLCIIEAMKLNNELQSPLDGVIVKIFPKDGQPVEFGEPLFAIDPS
ncbi:MAG: acetyl-CoA carboxylase biotin carboxyl carrier protein [Acidobacteriota bacterium]